MPPPKRKLLLFGQPNQLYSPPEEYICLNEPGLPISRVPKFHPVKPRWAQFHHSEEALLNLPMKFQEMLVGYVRGKNGVDGYEWAVVDAGRYIEDAAGIGDYDWPPSSPLYAVILEAVDAVPSPPAWLNAPPSSEPDGEKEAAAASPESQTTGTQTEEKSAEQRSDGSVHFEDDPWGNSRHPSKAGDCPRITLEQRRQAEERYRDWSPLLAKGYGSYSHTRPERKGSWSR